MEFKFVKIHFKAQSLLLILNVVCVFFLKVLNFNGVIAEQCIVTYVMWCNMVLCVPLQLFWTI